MNKHVHQPTARSPGAISCDKCCRDPSPSRSQGPAATDFIGRARTRTSHHLGVRRGGCEVAGVAEDCGVLYYPGRQRRTAQRRQRHRKSELWQQQRGGGRRKDGAVHQRGEGVARQAVAHESDPRREPGQRHEGAGGGGDEAARAQAAEGGEDRDADEAPGEEEACGDAVCNKRPPDAVVDAQLPSRYRRVSASCTRGLGLKARMADCSDVGLGKATRTALGTRSVRP